MKRPSTMRLALMGGGATLALGAGYAFWPGESEACRLARLENRPDAAAACRSGSSGSSSSARGLSSGSSGGEASSVSRGGFGASGHAAGS